MHYYLATMEVVDTTSVTDFEPQDERFFKITHGPYAEVQDARINVPERGDCYMLRFEGIQPTGIAIFHDYDLLWHRGGMECWIHPNDWIPHNLDTVLYELIEDARRYRDLCK